VCVWLCKGFRHIATLGTLMTTRNERHHVKGTVIWFKSNQALQWVSMSQWVKHRIHQDRLHCRLNWEESDPFNPANYAHYNQMILNVLNLCVAWDHSCHCLIIMLICILHYQTSANARSIPPRFWFIIW
jgi:hypothetical protein